MKLLAENVDLIEPTLDDEIGKSPDIQRLEQLLGFSLQSLLIPIVQHQPGGNA